MSQSEYDDQSGLQHDSYDRVSALLTTLLIVFGSVVTLLFIAWLTFEQPELYRVVVPGTPVPSSGQEVAGESTGLGDLDLADRAMIADVDDGLGSLVAVISLNPNLLDPLPTAGSDEPREVGPPGPEGPTLAGDEDLPQTRKEVRYVTTSAAAYAKQLDFFGVRIAAIDRNTYTADVVATLASSPAKSKMNRHQLRQAFVLSFPMDSEYRKLDLELLNNAGVKVRPTSIVVHILPPQLIKELAELELGRLKRRSDAAMIYKTVFGVRRQGKGYKLYVIDQEMR